MRDEPAGTPSVLTRSLSPEPTDVEEGEISLDAFKGSKQIRGLSTANSLDQVLDKFGYQPDDRLDRREQILMFRRTQGAFDQRIKRLVSLRLYDEAKSRRQALLSLRSAFEGLQENERNREHERQRRLLEQGKKLATVKLSSSHEAEVSGVEALCSGMEDKLAKKHRFQEETLEREIAGTQEPRFKNSTRLHYLKTAERNLVRLYQYDDAKNVAAMIRKLEPVETEAHHQRFLQSLKHRRDKLHGNQEEDRQRLHELSTSIRWKDIRRREAERSLLMQRIRNLTWDMRHSQALEARQRVEMGPTPSALLAKRPGYRLTGSGHRGQQFLDSVKGKRDKRDQVFVVTLTDIHDFRQPLSGTEVAAA